MKNVKQVLTIAGSDSGGGAGIQADLKTFQECKVFGMSIIVAVTAQNTRGVQGSYPLPLEAVQAQFNSIFSDFEVSAMKTGMLVGSSYIQLIASEIQKRPEIPYVLDPVMIAKGGSPLMEDDAISDLIEYLVPLATLVTPNIPEAERIADISIKTKEDMIKAAKIIQRQGAKNVLLKGGHLEESQSDIASDYLLLENKEDQWFENDRVYTENTHGTGDTLASCTVAELAKGSGMREAVALGIDFVHTAISDGITVGHGHGPTNHWSYRIKEERMK